MYGVFDPMKSMSSARLETVRNLNFQAKNYNEPEVNEPLDVRKGHSHEPISRWRVASLADKECTYYKKFEENLVCYLELGVILELGDKYCPRG